MRECRISIYGKSGALLKQRDFHRSNATFRAYVGGYGSGKTLAGCWEAWMLSQLYPGTVGIICRNTYGELRDSTRATFFKMLADITEMYTGIPGDPYDPETCPLVKSFSITTNDLVLYTPGKAASLILFRSLDRPEKFKSLELGWFWIDEASDTKEEAFLMLMGRLRHPAQRGNYKGFLTTNPSSNRHWIYKRFVEGFKASGEVASYKLFQAKTSENSHLPAGYQESLRASYPANWVKRYLDGEFSFIAEGERVYPEFDERYHVRAAPYKSNLSVLRGWDFGLRHSACVFAQIESEIVFVIGEIQAENELIENFSKKVLFYCSTHFSPDAKYEDYCDPSGHQGCDKSPHTSVEILKKQGIYPKSSQQRILDGVMLIRMLLMGGENPRLILDPRCRTLCEGFLGGYHYPHEYNGTGEDPQPFKDGFYDHLQDALRYLVWNTKLRTLLPKGITEKNKANSFESWKKAFSKGMKNPDGTDFSFSVK